VFSEGSEEKLKVLMTLGKIGDFILEHFDALKTLQNWKDFCARIAPAHNEEDRDCAENCASEVVPANCNDLFWKTKVRLLARHSVGFGDLEGQKRTASFTCAMMGILPVDAIPESNVRDVSCRIGKKMNDCQLLFLQGPNSAASQLGAESRLMKNQAKRLPLKIGLLNDGPGSTHSDVCHFYLAFSGMKANAASSCQDRSWKEMASFLCESEHVRDCVIPADFRQDFFERMEEKLSTTTMVPNANLTDGAHLKDWAKARDNGTVEEMFTKAQSPCVKLAMPKEASKRHEELHDFKRVLNDGWGKTKTHFTLPSKIPSPVPINAIGHLIFLVGPAAARESSHHHNEGLENLKAVIKAKGKGVIDQSIASDCFEGGEKNHVQSVSEEDKQS
jgi:hypothetical protein